MQDVQANVESLADRRNHARTHVLFSGCLISGDRSARVILLDLSAGGARVCLAQPLEACSAVTLRLAEKIDFHVEVVWRQGQMIGLKFREAPAKIAATMAGLLSLDGLAA
jgi:hypothetical protein